MQQQQQQQQQQFPSMEQQMMMNMPANPNVIQAGQAMTPVQLIPVYWPQTIPSNLQQESMAFVPFQFHPNVLGMQTQQHMQQYVQQIGQHFFFPQPATTSASQHHQVMNANTVQVPAQSLPYQVPQVTPSSCDVNFNVDADMVKNIPRPSKSTPEKRIQINYFENKYTEAVPTQNQKNDRGKKRKLTSCLLRPDNNKKAAKFTRKDLGKGAAPASSTNTKDKDDERIELLGKPGSSLGISSKKKYPVKTQSSNIIVTAREKDKLREVRPLIDTPLGSTSKSESSDEISPQKRKITASQPSGFETKEAPKERPVTASLKMPNEHGQKPRNCFDISNNSMKCSPLSAGIEMKIVLGSKSLAKQKQSAKTPSGLEQETKCESPEQKPEKTGCISGYSSSSSGNPKEEPLSSFPSNSPRVKGFNSPERKEHHHGQQYVCDRCRKVFATTEMLKKHLSATKKNRCLREFNANSQILSEGPKNGQPSVVSKFDLVLLKKPGRVIWQDGNEYWYIHVGVLDKNKKGEIPLKEDVPLRIEAKMQDDRCAEVRILGDDASMSIRQGNSDSLILFRFLQTFEPRDVVSLTIGFVGTWLPRSFVNVVFHPHSHPQHMGKTSMILEEVKARKERERRYREFLQYALSQIRNIMISYAKRKKMSMGAFAKLLEIDFMSLIAWLENKPELDKNYPQACANAIRWFLENADHILSYYCDSVKLSLNIDDFQPFLIKVEDFNTIKVGSDYLKMNVGIMPMEKLKLRANVASAVNYYKQHKSKVKRLAGFPPMSDWYTKDWQYFHRFGAAEDETIDNSLESWFLQVDGRSMLKYKSLPKLYQYRDRFLDAVIRKRNEQFFDFPRVQTKNLKEYAPIKTKIISPVIFSSETVDLPKTKPSVPLFPRIYEMQDLESSGRRLIKLIEENKVTSEHVGVGSALCASLVLSQFLQPLRVKHSRPVHPDERRYIWEG